MSAREREIDRRIRILLERRGQTSARELGVPLEQGAPPAFSRRRRRGQDNLMKDQLLRRTAEGETEKADERHAVGDPLQAPAGASATALTRTSGFSAWESQ